MLFFFHRSSKLWSRLHKKLHAQSQRDVRLAVPVSTHPQRQDEPHEALPLALRQVLHRCIHHRVAVHTLHGDMDGGVDKLGAPSWLLCHPRPIQKVADELF